MQLTEILKHLQERFAEIPGSVYHYWRPKMEPPFTVWQEDGESGLEAENHKTEQGITGTLDYFTSEEYDPVIDEIQNVLNRTEISWQLNSVQYEHETGLKHYEWRWEVC